MILRAQSSLSHPNPVPPITRANEVFRYQIWLRNLKPEDVFKIFLYMNDSVTPQTIVEVKGAGIVA